MCAPRACPKPFVGSTRRRACAGSPKIKPPGKRKYNSPWSSLAPALAFGIHFSVYVLKNIYTSLLEWIRGKITVGQAISRGHLLGLQLDYKCVPCNKKKKTQYDHVICVFRFIRNYHFIENINSYFISRDPA
jgi:hypothetical protein